jgi:beta-galactosidase
VTITTNTNSRGSRTLALPFDADWTFTREGANPETVVLPHDAMLAEPRSPEAASGSHGGYFPGGRYSYTRRWRAPGDLGDRTVTLVFEGVQGECEVLLDGEVVGRHPNGYDEFEIPLHGVRNGTEHEIRVNVDNTALPSSRWYTGSGIYRPVHLRIEDAIHLQRDGVRVHTTAVHPRADVAIDLAFTNPAGADVDLEAALSRHGRIVATASTTSMDEQANLELTVENPALWSADDPNLYELTVAVTCGGHLRDVQSQAIGLRTVELDRARGLLLNGQAVLLRGGCVHHDNGVIGATTLAAAERRRVRIMKEWGYNAVRSAHNPMSRAFLDACDELGMYVLDEYTDVWYVQKVSAGTTHFDTRWRGDLNAMVAKDRNRPSVIMYSIGNEIPETGAPYGVTTARAMTEHLHSLDPDRPVTLGVNPMINAMTRLGKDRHRQTPPSESAKPMAAAMDSTAFNVAMNQIGSIMNVLGRTPLTDGSTRDVFGVLDVAGYNYGRVRMAKDLARYPDRLLMGTESMPGDIPAIWSIVESSPRALGDFSWTAWDYLGEAGLGTWIPGKRIAPMAKPYPYLTAGAGAIDITGAGGALAQLAKVTWGLAPTPLISVRPLDRSGQPVAKAAWRTTDAIPSWAWRGKDGVQALVEVFSDAEEVELRLDGRLVGRKRAGRKRGNVARFSLAWREGELTAIAFRGGVEVGRSALRSSRGALALRLKADRATLAADGHDAAFVTVEIADADGTVEQLADDEVELRIEGPATLAGFASAAPATEEAFSDLRHTTYRGRALAVIRSSHLAGDVRVTARSLRYGESHLDLHVAEEVASTTKGR